MPPADVKNHIVQICDVLQVLVQNMEVVQHLGANVVDMMQNQPQSADGGDGSDVASHTPLHDGAAVRQHTHLQHQSAAGLKQRIKGDATEGVQMTQLPRNSSGVAENDKDA